MTKFEYKVSALEASSIEKKLNELGADGWELIEASFQANPNNYELNMYRVILKRVIKSKTKILNG